MMKESTYEPIVVRRRRRRQQSWLRRVTRRPRHFIREHKALSVLVAFALLLLILLLIWLWILNNKLNDIPRFDVELDNRPPDLGGVNILLVGVDEGKGHSLEQMVDDEEWSAGVFRSDALLLVHLDDNLTSAQVFSIPRDSRVAIPDNPYCSSPCMSKINAAFSWGGPEMLWQSVEDLTNVYVDHMMIADFDGFKDITETLDGITVYIPEESANPAGSDLLNPGWQNIRGDEALYYVRARYQLPRGDFDRVQRQQNVIRSVIDAAATWSVFANPVKLTQLVGDVAENLAVDDSLTNGRLRELAFASRNLRSSTITFATIPNQGSATVDGASVVLVNPREVRRLFDAVLHGEYAEYVQEHRQEIDTLPGPTEVG